MNFSVGQHVYVAQDMWGTTYRAIIESYRDDGCYNMVWASNGLPVVSPESQLTPVPPLQLLAEVAE